MKQSYKTGLILVTAVLFTTITFISFYSINPGRTAPPKVRSSASPHASIELKKERGDYFLMLLRDPKTGKIPPYIRQRELQFAAQLKQSNLSLRKSAAMDWHEAGPHDVGGRTRALAVDVNNSNIILAGGASGGIWKSTDKGASWVMKSTTSTILSVTTIAQDPRPGSTNTWYYATGEMSGSGNDLGFRAFFTGDGIYKSTDNGETWNVLPSTLSSNNTQWESDFDYVLNIAVSPATGHVFVASNGAGIFRSTDGGTSFTNVLGGVNQHVYSDVDVASNGTVLAVLSAPFQGTTATNAPGVYKSVNNGANWTKITTAGYPATSRRSVLDIAPSNPDVAYVLTHTGAQVNNREEIKFFKISIGAGTSTERSNNLPDFSALGGAAERNGFVTSQGGYDLAVSVKPDNENYVMIAGTCLFRSTDGFATKPTESKTAWIGGYHATNFRYPNFHPDVHSFAFDPADPNKMWWGHDGGLSYTDNVTNTSYAEYFPWQSKNNGYNVTQFYHISINSAASDNRIVGGTQDNGSPFFRYTGTIGTSTDVSSGDGSFSYLGTAFAYTSSQNGNVLRLKYDAQGNPMFDGGWSGITPTGATNQSFINPFCVDPSNENVMYYPAGDVIWRNNQLSSIPDFQNGTSQGWSKLDNISVPSGYSISALSVSTTPASLLYYAGSSFNEVPKIYKLSNATAATSGSVEISIPNAPAGAYVHNIAVNPDDANEIVVVLSNYNIVGLYHSTNGGQNYTTIEGNLQGTEQNPGPSLRSASILPTQNGKLYLVATSIGMYSAESLNGNSTAWTQEGASVLGNVIVNHVTSRKSDGLIVAGTHGRGAFVANAGSGGGNAVLNVNTNQLRIEVQPGASRSKEIVLSNAGNASLNYSISATSTAGKIVNGRSITTSFKPQLTYGVKNMDTDPYRLNSSIAAGTDSLYADDGNASPDNFFGYNGGQFLYWLTTFQMQSNFSLERIKFYMRTETETTNILQIAVAKVQNGNLSDYLYDRLVNLAASANGTWYNYQLEQAVSFTTGDTVAIIIGAQNSFLLYPAAFDFNGTRPNNSYYYNVFTSAYDAINTVTGIPANSAWLVRIVGTGATTSNQPPVANAQVSPNPANVNQTVTFNGTASSDADGQIVQYAWTFGDGGTSNQATATHAYTQEGQFNYSLTVTDDKGATGTSGGTVTVAGTVVVRWTITPFSGTVPAGGNQVVKIEFNSEGLAEGTYQGQISITSNGGNTTIPVEIFVSNTAGVEDGNMVNAYRLEQNFPNPFNPVTTIRWSLAQPGNVTLKVYDLNGAEVSTLVNEFRNAGTYETKVDMNLINERRSLASGVYFYKLDAGSFSQTRKFVLLK